MKELSLIPLYSEVMLSEPFLAAVPQEPWNSFLHSIYLVFESLDSFCCLFF